jgi:hypothetical protein
MKKLEITLGPDTAGLVNSCRRPHSGAVTAGVLRGDKSRFQLFGDTMNTTARIESVNRTISISSDTANWIKDAGKTNWLKKRDEVVYAKGKGEMETYWLVFACTLWWLVSIQVPTKRRFRRYWSESIQLRSR